MQVKCRNKREEAITDPGDKKQSWDTGNGDFRKKGPANALGQKAAGAGPDEGAECIGIDIGCVGDATFIKILQQFHAHA